MFDAFSHLQLGIPDKVAAFLGDGGSEDVMRSQDKAEGFGSTDQETVFALMGTQEKDWDAVTKLKTQFPGKVKKE